MLVGNEIKFAQVDIKTVSEGLASYEIRQLPLNRKFVIQFYCKNPNVIAVPIFNHLDEGKKVFLSVPFSKPKNMLQVLIEQT